MKWYTQIKREGLTSWCKQRNNGKDKLDTGPPHTEFWYYCCSKIEDIQTHPQINYFFVFISIDAWVNMTSSTSCDPAASFRETPLRVKYPWQYLHIPHHYWQAWCARCTSFCKHSRWGSCQSSLFVARARLSDHGLEFTSGRWRTSEWQILWTWNSLSISTAPNQINNIT